MDKKKKTACYKNADKQIETFCYDINHGKKSLIKLEFLPSSELKTFFDNYYIDYFNAVANLVLDGKSSDVFDLSKQKENIAKREDVKADYNFMIEGTKAFLNLPKTQFAENKLFGWNDNVAYDIYSNYINSAGIPTLYRTKLLQSFLYYKPKTELEKNLKNKIFKAVKIKTNYSNGLRLRLQLFDEMATHNGKCTRDNFVEDSSGKIKSLINKIQDSYFNSMDFADTDQMFKNAIPFTLELAAFKRSGEFSPITAVKK